ncbi:hypothetical protein GGG16DRAFT_107114 [Schizophyllum commune]
MWWLDPGKEVLNVLFNRILAPYVENLDMNQVGYGIGQGQLTLRNLHLRKGALDKFRLPVDVQEGHLGKFTLSLHWMNLGNQPVEILVEDVYLLVVPTNADIDPKEEEARAQAAKAERLENAELLHMRGQSDGSSADSPQQQGLIASLIAKIINNVQVTVKNIHIRYEDKISMPGRPFAAGLTLAGFTAVSVNGNWEPAFIESTAGAIHKLARLQSLAVYFDTNSESIAGLPLEESTRTFSKMIATGTHIPEHQFVLKPVSGEGHITMNHRITKETPHFDVQLLFDELGIVLDDDQYRDAISLVDMYHVYLRQRQYRKFRPPAEDFAQNPTRARLRFAAVAILEEVRERKRKWSWAYFAERRDDRNRYIELFQRKLLNTLTADKGLEEFQALERKLSYEDLRFYRSVARSRMKKDENLRKRLEAEKAKEQPQKQSWSSWIWGSSEQSTSQSDEDAAFGGSMTEQQKKELYDVLDYDEKAALTESLQMPRDSLKLRVAAMLKKGSLGLRSDPHGTNKEIISVVFNVLQATVLQRPDNFEASIALGNMAVFDGTTEGTLYPQIVQVKHAALESSEMLSTQVEGKPLDHLFEQDPFFFVKFEANPLDERADSAVTMRMRHMEIIYHRGYVEAIYKFFKPPASQLESVEALLSVASQTLEGLRKDTRAGLEYALQNHKTVDIQMDMNAPIIIIPESVATHECTHLLIDAGHISIHSELADKDAKREIHAKRKQQYTDEDYKRLESLMYDKIMLRLEAAQFIIGNDLESCKKALTAEHDSLHLLERINVNLQAQNSIAPAALNLARFKLGGTLPHLKLNFSDSKYKALMRLIDVCIPHFDDDDEGAPAPPALPSMNRSASGGLALFGSHPEYDFDDNESEDEQNDDQDEFFEAHEPDIPQPELHQKIFQLEFSVDNLQAVVSKVAPDGFERRIGEVTFDRFALQFGMAKYDMKVHVRLRSVAMDVFQMGADPIRFMSSVDSESTTADDLLTVDYTRAQKASPEFLTVYEGIDQNIDVKISTFVFKAAPEAVLMLYDFIMTTFVPDTGNNAEQQDSTVKTGQGVEQPVQAQAEDQKIRVLVKLASIQVAFSNGSISLATLSLSTADVFVLVRPQTLHVGGRLGSLSLSNDSSFVVRQEYSQILSIEGEDFADFQYQTFDPTDASYQGIKSLVTLNTASVKFQFLEGPLHGIYMFFVKLAKLKGLYDAATQAAVQSAPDVERMQFKISIKSPIVVFPTDPEHSRDNLVMRLGEISASNKSEQAKTTVSATLRGLQLVSNMYRDDVASTLKIIDDIAVTATVVQTEGIDRSRDSVHPDTQVAVHISDVRLHLTQTQYAVLLALSQAIPKVFETPPDLVDVGSLPATPVHTSPLSLPSPAEPAASLEPELKADALSSHTTMELTVDVETVKLHLYDSGAFSEQDLRGHGIARLALNDSNLRMKQLSNGAGEAQIVLKSFTVSNTRPGSTKFRDFIPAAQHERNQFMLLYTTSGGSNNNALAVLTIDAPQIIFAIDPVFALAEFFTSGLPKSDEAAVGTQPEALTQESHTVTQQGSSTDFRLDLHEVSIVVLEDDTDSESQAIQLGIDQIQVSQQGILALSVSKLGMSLLRMGKPSESVRFLDEFDATLTMDSRPTTAQQMTNLEIACKPIVFRASHRDINLISSIVNKAISLYNASQPSSSLGGEDDMQTRESHGTSGRNSKVTRSRNSGQPLGKAHLLTSKEQFTGSFDGFRLVLIGDMHEQPMLHLRVKPFNVNVRDWTGELKAQTTIALQIGYWNLTNSHWEPLIDPWTFTASVSREDPMQNGGLHASLASRERLDINLSATFAELALSSLNTWNAEGENMLRRGRGSYAPYRIRNRSGSPIFIWADNDSNADTKDVAAVRIQNDETVDWRFDDWKTMREHVSNSSQHSIGVQFIGKAWEQVRTVPVDREGEFVFSLRPRTDRFPNRVLCEVKVVDNVKVVTIRSTYKIENRTLYPLEITLVNASGHPAYPLEKIAPGEDYALPIEAVMQTRVRIQPDQGFGYKWCSAIRWEDLVARQSFSIKCAHSDPHEAAFRFQASVQTDARDTAARRYPKITLRLCAPIELENLLPYNIQYRVYDKNADQNWRSYLRKGGVMPVHSVDLGHLVLLNIDVQDTDFKPSEFSIVNTDAHSDFEIEDHLTLRDLQDRKLQLRLNYIRYPESGGAFKVQIYAPYLLVNKTSMPFVVKSIRANRALGAQEMAGDYSPAKSSQRTAFLLSHSSESDHEFAFKFGESEWSKPLSFKAPAAESVLVIPSQKRKGEEVQTGITWTEGSGKYKLTKVITVAPRFIVKNNLSHPLAVREHGVGPGDKSVLEPGQRLPLLSVRKGPSKLLTAAYPGVNAKWSPPLNIGDIGSVYLRLTEPEQSSGGTLIRANVDVSGSTIFVTFDLAEEGYPIIIDNRSDYAFTFRQIASHPEDRIPQAAVYELAPHSQKPYIWDYPAAKDKKIVLVHEGRERVVDVMEIGDLVPWNLNLPSRRNDRVVSLDVRADGPRQILEISNYVEELSVYKPRPRSNSTATRQDSISSTEAFEAVSDEVKPNLTFDIDFEGIGISLINKKLTEVVYMTLTQLKFEYSDSPVAQAINLTCGSIQLDNQLHDAIYPVILQPTPIPKEANGVAGLPTIQSSLMWLKDQEHGVVFIKYCSVLLQALTIEADEDLLFSIYDLTQINGAWWEENAQDVLIDNLDDVAEPTKVAEGTNLYFEVLELQPIKLYLSFMRTERVSSDQKLSLRNPLAVVINAITMAVGNINDAPLEMNALAIKDMRLTPPELTSRILYHYRQDVLRQLYRILGSADFIGNPVGLFTNVSSGVADIFYEPFNGVVMHGNSELGIGIAKGAASFVKKTVFGVSDSFTKFTSSVGKGLSVATFDSEYQARRRLNQRRNKPRHAIYGVTAGGEALANSVASAMEGVVMKPIEGAESEGALGFFKGVGKGIVGAVTKPVVGVFDLASNVSEGIRNTTTVFDNPERDRARLPRHIPPDGVLRPYSAREAMGQYWLRDLENGMFRNESYVAHIVSPGGETIILLTTNKVLSVAAKRLRLDWELPFTQVAGVTVEDNGIRFQHKAGKEQDKFVYIPDKSSQSWFFGEIASVVKAHNARRRMDG